MKSTRIFALILLVIGAALWAACQSPPAVPAGTNEDDGSAAGQTDNAAAAPVFATWDEVLAAAEGTTVNWHMWGGSETINRYVDEQIAPALAEEYGVTLNRVPLDDTADAVNQVLNERVAGRTSNGSIDMIWINAANFRTLKEAELLYGPFVELLPNTQFVNYDDPAVTFDFGVPTDGFSSPWASFQWVIEYSEARVPNPPTSFEELRTWVQENPGRFTYPAPPNHVGSAFVRQLFYWAAGDSAPFLDEFDQELYDEVAPQVWDYLNEIEPFLWREGQTYPELATMADLLANGEIDFAMEYDANRASTYIAEGRYPDTIRTLLLDTGTVANVSYVTIPFNAPNAAGAMVVANYLISPDYQIALSDPSEGLGWMVAIEPSRLSEDEQAALAAIERGPATLPADTLRAAALPESRASWVTPMDDGWEENVLER